MLPRDDQGRAVTALAISVLAALAASCSGGWGPTVCTGGARAIGSNCFCPKGTSFDGASCQGTPEQGNCVPGAMEVVGDGQSVCYCPDGFVWTDGQQSCAPCEGGSVAVGDTCQCQNNTIWDGNVCAPCQGGAIASNNACVCPDGTAWDGAQCQQTFVAEPTCTGGAVMTQAGCQCPQGTAWDGANCVSAPAGGPVIIEQRTHQRNVSLTCCINGANYTCPNEAEFRACTTLQAHNCARAGGC